MLDNISRTELDEHANGFVCNQSFTTYSTPIELERIAGCAHCAAFEVVYSLQSTHRVTFGQTSACRIISMDACNGKRKNGCSCVLRAPLRSVQSIQVTIIIVTEATSLLTVVYSHQRNKSNELDTKLALYSASVATSRDAGMLSKVTLRVPAAKHARLQLVSLAEISRLANVWLADASGSLSKRNERPCDCRLQSQSTCCCTVA